MVTLNYKKLSHKHWLFPAILLTMAGCQPTRQLTQPHKDYNPQSIPLSYNNPGLRSCIYPAHIRVAHFPMFHYPPNGFQGDQKVFEEVSMSQFQLLHTIIAYKPYIAVFSEGILSDHYNERTYARLRQGTDGTTFSRLDGTVFHLQERFNTAWRLFPRKVTQNYEHLTHSQKEFLAYTGGALTAWLLGQIPHIYKTASESDMEAVTANLNRITQVRYQGNMQLLFNAPEGSDQERDHWLLHFREARVQQEVNRFYSQNRSFRGLVLIAYGANHKFHNEFSAGFSDGSFCLKWYSF